MTTLPHPGSAVSPPGRGASLRAWTRLLAGVLVALGFALAPALTAILTLGSRPAIAAVGTRTFRRICRVLCPLFGIRVTVDGRVPPGPVLLCPNHLSYLDILVLASAADAIFVSRADVARWPGIGPLSRLGGTVYLDRSRKRDAARAGDEAGEWLERGFRVVVFLEGGAGDGASVRTFRPSLLEPACRRGVPCAAVTLRYSIPPGSDATVATHVAWPDETPFTTHAMRFLRVPRTDVRVTIHAPRTGAERKALAAALERDCASGFGRVAPPTAAADPSPGR